MNNNLNYRKVDYEKYRHLLDNSDATEEQKEEFLQILWDIVLNFVDLGFGNHPVQLAIQEKDPNNLCESKTSTLRPEDMVYSDHIDTS